MYVYLTMLLRLFQDIKLTFTKMHSHLKCFYLVFDWTKEKFISFLSYQKFEFSNSLKYSLDTYFFI